MIYESPTGEYYSAVDIWTRFESGAWTPHDWDAETGREWVRTDDGDVIQLTPVELSDLPERVSVREVEEGVIIDRDGE